MMAYCTLWENKRNGVNKFPVDRVNLLLLCASFVLLFNVGVWVYCCGASSLLSVFCIVQLNEADGPMLLTGCSDGTVRVWRNYTLPGTQLCACKHVCVYAPAWVLNPLSI